MENFSRQIAVIIPSLNPDENMVKYVQGLKDFFSIIIIVDDGSNENTKQYFEAVSQYACVSIIQHSVNKGKGRALKTGFSYILEHYSNEVLKGVVTADADGQHSVEDTVKTAKALCESGNVILGMRDFNAENVPFKSRSGNKITTTVFAMLYGKWLHDTQTGLRGIPFDYLPRCLELAGEKFDYEIMMLIDMVRQKRKIQEVPIETIYINSNRATHFDAVKDSWRIYKVILRMFFKFSLSGIISFLADILLFSLLSKGIFTTLMVSANVLWSTIIARIVSSIINYSLNKKIVFSQNGKNISSFIKYYILCIAQLLCSWLLVVIVYNHLQFDTTIIKIIVDTCLFILSYQIQQHWVFSGRQK